MAQYQHVIYVNVCMSMWKYTEMSVTETCRIHFSRLQSQRTHTPQQHRVFKTHTSQPYIHTSYPW